MFSTPKPSELQCHKPGLKLALYGAMRSPSLTWFCWTVLFFAKACTCVCTFFLNLFSPFSSSENSTSCLQCPAGHACPTPSAPPTSCLIGTYAYAGSESCDPCPIGFQCALIASQAPVPCPNGTFANETAQSSCTLCPEGKLVNYCLLRYMYHLLLTTILYELCG